jgi:glycosyltransferase involved in cell wall biosynthesis
MIRMAYLLTPVDFGGAEKVNLTFLENVDRSRFDISPVLFIRPWEEHNVFIRKLEDLAYPFHRIPVAMKPRSEGRDTFRAARCLRELGRILREDHFDLIHTHGYFADVIGTPWSRRLRIAHIATCHGFISNDRHLVLYNRLDRFVLRFCDRIIAVSGTIKNDLLKNGIPRSRIVVIKNAVGTSCRNHASGDARLKKREEIGAAPEERVVGYVGRLSPEKGVNFLIDAAKALKDSGQRFRILLLGDGPKRKTLEEQVAAMGLSHHVLFAGFQAEVQDWLPALDCFVLPSLTEGTPMALLEAMSFGIPVIAARVGGVPGIIEDGVNGMLMNPHDPAQLGERLEALFQSPSLRERLGKEAMSTVLREYNVRDWCRKIESQYELLLSKDILKKRCAKFG